MQTTLLGLAIAFILALLAALIGPYVFDWNQFRPQFEAEASRVLGAPVRVAGKLDARLLPVPSLRLNSVSIGGANDAGRLSAERFDVEFSLGALMRGEVRASELTINGVSLDLGLDEKGQVDWPAVSKLDLRALAIERLNLTGRVALHDAASKSTLELNDIAFAGDVRGAAGALRGDGNFTLNGTRYPFRFNTTSPGELPGTRLRLAVDANSVPLTLELDGLLTAESRRPRFEGTLVLARPQRPNSTDGLPWRTVTKLKADPSGAVLDQIDVTSGAEESGLKLSGAGDMRFGALPFLRATLAAKSIDGDRLLGNSGAAATLLPALAEGLAALPQFPFAADISTNIEQVMLAGRPVQDIGVELRTAGSGWSVSRLDFRGPGATRVSLAGAFSATQAQSQASGFDGRMTLVSTDPDAFANWLQGRGDGVTRLQKPLRIGGQLKLAAGRIALDAMTAEIDGGTVKGRLMLARPETGASRIEAALQADRLDIDAAVGMLRTLTSNRDGWPSEGQIALDIGQAVAAGQEMKPFGVSLAYDAQGINLERLRVGEASGVTLDGSGNFDRKAGTGTLSLNAATPSLSRFAALLGPAAPQIAARVASLGRDDGPARVSLSLGLDNDAAKPDLVKTRGSLAIDAAAIKGALTLTASPKAADVRALDIDKLRQSDVTIEGKLSTSRGRTLAALLGIDGVLAVGDTPLAFEMSGTGAWSSSWRGAAKVTGVSLDADLQGSIEPWAEPRAAALRVALRRANIAPLLGISADDPLSRDVSLTSKLTVAGDRYAFDGIDGVVAGARLRGRTTVTLQDVRSIDGEIGLDRIELGPAFGLAIGSAGHDANEPVSNGWLLGWRGRMGFVALRAVLPGGLELQSFSGGLRNDGNALVLEGLKAKLGGGELTAEVEARPGVTGLALTTQIQLANVEGQALAYRGLTMPAGKTALRLTLASQGRSAAALASAISGEGLATLSSMRLAGLDPKAIEAAVNASDQSRVGDDATLRRIVEPALAAGALSIGSAQIPFVIKDGRLRVNATLLETPEARAVVSGGYDFTADQADYRATLTALDVKGVGNSLPELQVFAVGPPDRMTRAVDIAPLSSWLAIRAIDRETRRLDALERTAPPSIAAVPPAAAPVAQPDAAPADTATVPPEVSPAPLPRPRVPRVMPPPVPQASVPQANAQNAPALPPAIDVGPPPGVPRAARPRPPMPLTPPSPRPAF